MNKITEIEDNKNMEDRIAVEKKRRERREEKREERGGVCCDLNEGALVAV